LSTDSMLGTRPSEISSTGYPRRSSTAILSMKASTAAASLAEAPKNVSQNKHVSRIHEGRIIAQRPHIGASALFQKNGRFRPIIQACRCTYQLPTTILIVRREPSFGCASSPRQLHVGSENALPGAQQCTAYDKPSSTLRRAIAACCALPCGTIISVLAGLLAASVGIPSSAQSTKGWQVHTQNPEHRPKESGLTMPIK
jgi:hypothetical protein